MSEAHHPDQLVSVRGKRFADPQGRHLLLHGISLVNKDPSVGYLGTEDARTFRAMRNWGLNCVRLGVIWDGLEPQPGVYDETYLQGIDRQVSWARAHGLHVFLDMHQDLYSVLYADGAPEWATLTDGAPHVADSPVWSDAYFGSPAVQTALDHFWNNTPAPDGTGIQEHYARAWAKLAERYAANSTVIGFDLMNEPFPGALATQALGLMLAKGAELQSQPGNASPVTAEGMARLWATPEGRSAALRLLDDVDVYAQIVDAVQPLYGEFEKTRLMAMYRRVASAIRRVDPGRVLFLEATMASNMGVRSAIEPLTLPNGDRDPFQAYAPHGYDLVTDTQDVALANPERIDLIFERHGETADRLGMPMLVGEWGAYGRVPGTLPAAWQVVEAFEKLLCSETYWTYIDGIERTPSFQAIHRPYPERIAGVLTSYRYDPAAGTFECAWQEDGRIAAPSHIYLPDWFHFDPNQVELTPEAAGLEVTPIRSGSGNRILVVPPTGQASARRLVIRQP